MLYQPDDSLSLDAILSVGYRVSSRNATLFRRWATAVLKDYLLKGYNINQRLVYMEERIDRRINSIESTLAEHQQKIDFFHCGHSIKDMGKKLTAIMLMGTPPETILNAIT